jgi:uncharacterized membrane protein YccC
MESVWEHGFASTDPREADLYQLGVVDAHWLLARLAEARAALAASEAARAALEQDTDELAAAGEALLAHFRRHTQHRCEIDRALRRASRPTAPSPERPARVGREARDA